MTQPCLVCRERGSFPVVPHGSADASCSICGADWPPAELVIFRVWRGEGGGVIALFPELIEYVRSGQHCTCYEHVGQHGTADYAGVISRTRPAKPKEYADLKRELEAAPYHYRLIVRKRWQRRRSHA